MGRVTVEAERWFPFPPASQVGLSILGDPRQPGRVTQVVPVRADFLRADRAKLQTTAFIMPGTRVLFPLDTIDGERLLQSAVVEYCQMVAVRQHLTCLRFDIPINTPDFVVCWGLAVGDEGYCEPAPERPPAWREDPGRARAIRLSVMAELAERLAAAARAGGSDAELSYLIGRLTDAEESLRRSDAAGGSRGSAA